MAESGLALTFLDLRQEVASFLGYGVDSTSWTTEETARIDRCVQTGLSRFYFNELGHDWSFRRPSRELTLWATKTSAAINVDVTGYILTCVSDFFTDTMVGHALVADTSDASYTIVSVTSATEAVVSTDATADTGDTFTITANGFYALPDDFQSLAGVITFDEDTAFPSLIKRPEMVLRQRRQVFTTLSRPTSYCTVPRGTTVSSTSGQRFDLLVDPIPDAAYYILAPMWILPPMLTTGEGTYPLGGAAFADVIKEACLAAAEGWRDDGGNGFRRAEFARMLASAAARDGKVFAADFFGNNNDRSLFSPAAQSLLQGERRSLTSVDYLGGVV
jgi:hypothetical protein